MRTLTRARLVSVFAAAREGWPRRAAYAALSVPLAVVYAALFVGLVASVVFAVQGIGIVLFFVLLATARGFGGLERRLARRLLGLDIAPDVRLRKDHGHVVRQLRLLVLTNSTWRTLAWLGARVLLGLGVFAALGFGFVAVVLLVLEAWSLRAALPLLALMAVLLLGVLEAIEFQVRIAAAVASRLLGLDPEEKIAALRQSSQRLADRNRLARDLHDTIGHALTASLLQATAARRTLAPDPADPSRAVDADFARQALAHIETNTRTALSELDRALTVLRDDRRSAATDVQVIDEPDLSNLGGLLTGLRDGGLPVTLNVGETRLAELPPEVSAFGYRVVQEGTTNVLRHAGCAQTTIELACAGDTLTVCVQNAPASPIESRPGPGGGTGLSGLRARAATVGGELTAGPTPAGGFELRATLPLSSST